MTSIQFLKIHWDVVPQKESEAILWRTDQDALRCKSLVTEHSIAESCDETKAINDKHWESFISLPIVIITI